MIIKQRIKCWTGTRITKLAPSQVFVFGSNPEGRHGLGAAKVAMSFGATYGKGRGLSGQSYALPTKNLKAGFIERCTGITYKLQGKRSISLSQIRSNILELYALAVTLPERQFVVVYQQSSNNLNGYSSNQIIEQFVDNIDVPDNMYFHESFRHLNNLVGAS